MDLISQLDNRRGLSETSRRCLRELGDEIAMPPFKMIIWKRGHFGDVLRWNRDQKPWFDALPAQDWVLFYLHKTASHTTGLDYATIREQLPHAVERRDLIVKIRLHDRLETMTIAALVNDAVVAKLA